MRVSNVSHIATHQGRPSGLERAACRRRHRRSRMRRSPVGFKDLNLQFRSLTARGPRLGCTAGEATVEDVRFAVGVKCSRRTAFRPPLGAPSSSERLASRRGFRGSRIRHNRLGFKDLNLKFRSGAGSEDRELDAPQQMPAIQRVYWDMASAEGTPPSASQLGEWERSAAYQFLDGRFRICQVCALHAVTIQKLGGPAGKRTPPTLRGITDWLQPQTGSASTPRPGRPHGLVNNTELAILLGVTPSQIGKYCRGKDAVRAGTWMALQTLFKSPTAKALPTLELRRAYGLAVVVSDAIRAITPSRSPLLKCTTPVRLLPAILLIQLLLVRHQDGPPHNSMSRDQIALDCDSDTERGLRTALESIPVALLDKKYAAESATKRAASLYKDAVALLELLQDHGGTDTGSGDDLIARTVSAINVLSLLWSEHATQ